VFDKHKTVLNCLQTVCAITHIIINQATQLLFKPQNKSLHSVIFLRKKIFISKLKVQYFIFNVYPDFSDRQQCKGTVQNSLKYMFIFLRPPPPAEKTTPLLSRGGGAMLIAYCYCYSYDFPNFVPRFNQHFSPSTVPLEGGPSAIQAQLPLPSLKYYLDKCLSLEPGTYREICCDCKKLLLLIILPAFTHRIASFAKQMRQGYKTQHHAM
jgi:hypothetical protein